MAGQGRDIEFNNFMAFFVKTYEDVNDELKLKTTECGYLVAEADIWRKKIIDSKRSLEGLTNRASFLNNHIGELAAENSALKEKLAELKRQKLEIMGPSPPPSPSPVMDVDSSESSEELVRELSADIDAGPEDPIFPPMNILAAAAANMDTTSPSKENALPDESLSNMTNTEDIDNVDNGDKMSIGTLSLSESDSSNTIVLSD